MKGNVSKMIDKMIAYFIDSFEGLVLCLSFFMIDLVHNDNFQEWRKKNNISSPSENSKNKRMGEEINGK